MIRWLLESSCVCLLAMTPSMAFAQQASPRPYDGIQAGLDAYRLGEERRRSDLQQQLNVNEDLRAWSGLPNLAGETMWYQNALRPSRDGNLDAMYGYGYSNRGGSGYSGPGIRSVYPGGMPGTVFEPWPYVPGDIWASNYVTPFRQPAGRWEGQTGPNRWESHPVYDPPITPYQASPPVDSPWLDRTPHAAPRSRFMEWSDGQAGVADTELPPPAPSLGVEKATEMLPPPADSVPDDFDRPRTTRDEARPTPPSPPEPRRLREF